MSITPPLNRLLSLSQGPVRKKPLRLVAPVLSAALVTTLLGACGGNKFGSARSKNGAPPPAVPNTAPSTNDAKSVNETDTAKASSDALQKDLASANASGALPGDKDVSGDVCTQSEGKLRVFILDLKSGWFAGDGGNTFKNFVMPACGGSVEFVYAHMTKSILEGTLFNTTTPLISCAGSPAPTPRSDGAMGILGTALDSRCTLGSLAEFQQIWILSYRVRKTVPPCVNRFSCEHLEKA